MRLLYITSLSGRRINGFMRSAIVAAKQLGIEFDMACNTDSADKALYEEDCREYGIRVHHIDFQRNPLDKKNYLAYKQLLKLLREERFDIIHCNTPIGGLLGRVCGKKAGVARIIYQAHGFHFYKGAPLKNWILYYPVERVLSRYTDVLITIAKDDFLIAQHMHAKRVEYIHGVGVDIKRFQRRSLEDRNNPLREVLNISDSTKVILSVGELNENKNHRVVLEALRLLGNDICYVICGEGALRHELEKYAKDNGLSERVHLVGFRSDVSEFYKMADLFVFPSIREGIPGAVLEAVATGIPIIASDIRGVRDIVRDESYRFSPFDSRALAHLIDSTIRRGNINSIDSNFNNLKPYLFDEVVGEIRNVYSAMIL